MHNIKTILLDYGATIDTNGIHWSEIIRKAYQNIHIPVEQAHLRNAYIHAERTLATSPTVKPEHNFWHVLQLKAAAQIDYLKNESLLPENPQTSTYPAKIADWCYAYAQIATNSARPILKKLAENHNLILVTNFYGNIKTVLEDFKLREMFSQIIESSVVGVRKPDPEIYRLAINASQCDPSQIAAVGDSYEKDIQPAATLGCRTIWLKNTGWNTPDPNATADIIISDFRELTNIFS